jgi:hypothetical protein
VNRLVHSRSVYARIALYAHIAFLLLSLPHAAWSVTLDGQDFSDDEIFTAVVQRFKKSLSHRFNPADTSDKKPHLIFGPKVKVGKKLQSQSFVHITQQELVEQQLAVFLLITEASLDPTRKSLYVSYDIPSNASFGVLKLFVKEGALAVESAQAMRSSSGARVTYGQLYEGVACQDETEMAYRWNYYENRRVSGRCLDKMFTEFTNSLELSRKLSKP